MASACQQTTPQPARKRWDNSGSIGTDVPLLPVARKVSGSMQTSAVEAGSLINVLDTDTTFLFRLAVTE